MIKYCSDNYLDIYIYVAGVMFRPDKEETVMEHIKLVNITFNKVCRDLKKKQKLLVSFIGAYKIFLENCMYR